MIGRAWDVNIKIPFLSGRNRQKMLLDKPSFVLNLEWKALKITFKILSLPAAGRRAACPLFKENSEEREKTR
jgi:hypothetical protein